jgi:hypothetical protein
VEVFDPSTPAGGQATTVVSQLPPNGPGHPSPWPNHEEIGLYPHMFLLPSTTELGQGGDKVLVAGPGKWDSAVIDIDDWVWTDVVDEPDTGQPRLSQDRFWGTAYMEPGGVRGSDRVVLLGGSDAGGAAPGPGTSPPPVATAETLDLNDPESGWRLGGAPALNTPRAHFNTVLLPDGSVFTNGGGYGRRDDTLYADPVYAAEYLPAGATAWRTVGSEADARTYHSVSVLLPDGRVLSAGDDRDIAPSHIPADARTAQMWSPPYLFDGARPVITFAPTALRHDVAFRVAVQGDPAVITGAALVRPGAVTHAVDMGQSVIRLDVTAQPDGLTMRTPLDGTVAPPGYYMLFLLNASGVPSVASWVRLGADAPDAPALPAPPAPPQTTPAPPAPPAAPAPGPAASRALRLSAARPVVRRAADGVRVRMSARTSVTASVVMSLSRADGRVVVRRSFRGAAGRTAVRYLVPSRAALRGGTRLRARVRATASGGRVAQRAFTVRVPAR